MFGRKIWETTSSPGTGTITLLGANPGYLRCRDMKPGATSIRACWQIDNETDTEVFIGTLTLGTPDTLTRDTVLMSTNGGAKINAVGTFSVFSPIDIIQALPRVNQQAGAYAVVAEDYNSVIEYTGTGDVTFTVPDVATLVPGFIFTLKHAGSAGSITFDPSGSQQYEGQATVVLRPGMSIQPVSTSTGWRERGNIGYLPAQINWAGKTIQAATLLNALLTGTVYGSAIGIGPEQLVINRNLGALAYLTTLPHSMLDKGSAGDLLIHDADGYGARLGIGATGQSLEISGGLPAWQTRTKVAQRVAAETGALDSTTTFIPNDDTIPQSGEGKQCASLDVTITPKASGNKLVGEVILNVSGSTALVLIASVVKNGVASALTAGAAMVYGNNELTQIKMSYEITAGSTSSQTFQVWFGPATNGQTMYINGANAARKFGGAYISSHKITEYWV